MTVTLMLEDFSNRIGKPLMTRGPYGLNKSANGSKRGALGFSLDTEGIAAAATRRVQR